jgi:hypothetical protein
MHLGRCEKGIIEYCEANSCSGKGAGDHGDIERKGIGHPAFVAD